ncbi:MAG TPA: 2-dehydropantoate 2-reductase [Burkholderiaceae bacterium]|nr:2-dehydropantoate 2-reductase [Burkholderiaceae bacterium]
MRIAIIGAGGLGGYFGARLQAAGSDVTFVARGAHLAAIREQGLRIKSALGDLHLAKVMATSDPSEVGTVDMVLVCVKLWDTEAVAQQLKSLIGPETGVVSFQNGVEKDEILVKALGAKAVLGGICYIAATIAQPGVIQHVGTLQKLVFGERDGTTSSRATQFLAECQKAGIDSALSTDIRRLTWEKFAILVGLSGTTTATRLPIGPIRSNEKTRAFLYDVINEVVLVGRAAGVELPADYAADRLRFVDTLPAEMTSSMHGDLKRGNRLELPWLSGAVVQMGKQLGVPTPANRAIADLLELHVNGA